MESDGNDQIIYEFSDFRLIPGEGLLMQNDVPVVLQPKAFAVLALLVRRNGHLVTKSEIIDTIWEDSFVEEASVSKAVYNARHVLGDSSQQQFIQTVPRRGYRFVAPVKILNSPDGASNGFERISTGYRLTDSNGGDGSRGESIDSILDSNIEVSDGSDASIKQTVDSLPMPSDTHADLPTRLFRRRHLFAISAAVLIAAGLFAVYISYPWSTTSSGGGTVKIAVLPFRPINAANRDEIYEIGIAHSLIHQISAINGLVVRPLSAIRRYDALDQDPIAAGREQKVDKVLESSYQLADGKFRITAQLINVASGQVEESFKVETDAGNVFAIQDAVASEIGNKLMARFGATTGTARKRGTSNEEAYRHYLQGMFLYDQRNGQKAVENFDRAVALDPNYALAWAGKALAHRAAAITRDSDTRREYESALLSINRALALDPSLSDAYSALCSNKLQFEYDFAGAEQACKRALELEPNSSIAHQTYTTFLNTRGRHDEAIASIKTAIDLDPSSFYNQRSYANSLYFARRYDEARVEYLRLWERNRNQRQTLEWMIRALDAGGREAEAFEWFVELSRFDKVDEKQVERFKTIFRTVGWVGVLREREKLDTSDDRYFGRALVNARIGDIDRAIQLLNKFYEERSGMMPILQIEPMLDPLRDDPRYAELVRRMESK